MGIGSRVVRTHLKKASRAVVKNMFRFEPFVRSRQGVSLLEVRSPNIS